HILEASSNIVVRSEEALTEGLSRIVLGPEAKFLSDDGISRNRNSLPTSDAISGKGLIKLGKGAINDRASFHDAVLRIGDAAKGKGYQLVSLVDVPIEVAGRVSTDAGYLFALRELNPFAILKADAAYREKYQILFARWQDDRSAVAADRHYS